MSILQGYMESGMVLNELFGFGKKKKNEKKETPPFPKAEYDRIVAKYKNKNTMPTWKSIDVSAYTFCKYEKEDLAKFCNAKDTNLFKKMIEENIHMVEEEEEYYFDDELNVLKALLKQTTPNSIVELTQSGSYSYLDGMVVYHKGSKAFYFLNNDEVVPYKDSTMEQFHDYIRDAVLYGYGYNIDKIEEETTSEE